MSAIIFLIFLGILVAGGFLAAFIWAVRSGQYDDDYSPSVRMLFDIDDIPATKSDTKADAMKTDEDADERSGKESR
jgi:cbb3-type cytochrome oxidase maturation protein